MSTKLWGSEFAELKALIRVVLFLVLKTGKDLWSAVVRAHPLRLADLDA
ncbi:MAG TPA: hypothetical protein VK709_14895 [Candidatus Saccharimonadales bacterium]|nr:hypothetical protein [Candidatus Saccharimonadales bacterium]